jgi:Zn-dependent peptidase ImmA (M78 family)/DNA-binding XRE family transcriptional regulator
MNSVLDSQNPVELGDRLRYARAQAGLTQAQAASALQVARTTLIALEKGQRRVRADELRAMSDIYGAPVSSLLRESAVHVELSPRFRALSEKEDEDANQAARLLNDLTAGELELERLTGRKLKTNYPPERPILPGDVKEQAEDLAMELRHRLGLGLAPIVDIVTLLEVEIGMRVFVRPLDSKISGLFIYDDEAGACMLLNRSHPRERRAMTAAHEFGHLVSSRRQPDILDDCSPQSREEKFATAFGLSFMAPAPTVRRLFQEYRQESGRFSPRHLILMAHSLNLSQEGICRRLEDLKLLPAGTWESLRDRGFSGELVRQILGDRPRDDEVVVPPRLWMLAAEAYSRELLTEGQLAQLLRIDRPELRRILDMLGSSDDHDLESLALE